MSSDLKSQVKKVMMEHLDIAADEFNEDTSFSRQLGLDSLDAMDLLLAIDEAFHVRIPVKEMELVDNLEQLVKAIQKQQV